MTDVAIRDPLTGLAVDLTDAADADLVDVLRHVDEFRAKLDDAVDAVHHELRRRMDRRGSWTLHVDDTDAQHWSVSAPSPDAGTVTYDPVGLRDDLDALVDAGVIDAAAVDRAVSRPPVKEPPLMVYAAGIRALEKMRNPTVTMVLVKHRQRVPVGARRVTVTRC